LHLSSAGLPLCVQARDHLRRRMTALGLAPGPHIPPHHLDDVVEPSVPELVPLAAALLRALEALEEWDPFRHGTRTEKVLRERELPADTGTAAGVVALYQVASCLA
ncbi:unnamed protein product, partial [Ectocarpus sp. 12 AP-2014]